MKWRLLEDNIGEPYRHFAIEEAVLRSVAQGDSPPTLRLRRPQPAVWIGLFQFPEEDVDIEYCASQGIPIVRRYNPGGAVYQDEGGFCYSLCFPKKLLPEFFHLTDPADFYSLTGQAVISTCREFGAEAQLSPLNDITIHRRKIYGSAQLEFYSAFVHSGTFLVKANIDEMARTLKPSRLKFADKGFNDVAHRVINLVEAIGHDVEVEAVIASLARHLASALKIQLQPAPLTPAEISLAGELFKTKYSNPAWTFRKQDTFRTVVSTKSIGGVITLGVTLEGDFIAELQVKGDFLVAEQEELARLVNTLRGKTMAAAPGLIQQAGLPGYFRQALVGLFQEACLHGEFYDGK